MRQYAVSDRVSNLPNPDGSPVVIEVESMTAKGKMYRVDITYGRCSCPSWIYQRGGVRKPCKHLRELGFVPYEESPEVMEFAEPQAQQSKGVEYEIL